ncbi:acyltransferase [Riemerella anatipestifer]|nr:acyltransferase [Riemerella anatipestifer]
MSNKVYFPNLNGIRAIAAFMVIIHHIGQFLGIFDMPNALDTKVIHFIGPLGVTLFFVLSGFLITYLLLAEEKSTGTIALKDFYIRRILRIWPLYYIIILASFFILPYIKILALPDGYWKPFSENFYFYLSLFLLFLPNIVLFRYGAVLPYGSQSWSVGVEEQFYLLWPILMKFVKNKVILIIGVIGLYVCMYVCMYVDWQK